MLKMGYCTLLQYQMEPEECDIQCVGRQSEELSLPQPGQMQPSILKSARMSIEHSFGQLRNLFKICLCKDEVKLGKKIPYALKQLRVCHLLQNCHVCFNGNSTSNKFLVPLPKIADYLLV